MNAISSFLSIIPRLCKRSHEDSNDEPIAKRVCKESLTNILKDWDYQSKKQRRLVRKFCNHKISQLNKNDSKDFLSLIQKIGLLFHGTTHTISIKNLEGIINATKFNQNSILKIIEGLPLLARSRLAIDNLVDLFTGFSELSFYEQQNVGDIIKRLHDLNVEKQSSFIEIVFPYLKTISDYSQKVHVVNRLVKADPKNLSFILQKVFPLLKNVNCEKKITYILECVELMGEFRSEKIVQNIISLFNEDLNTELDQILKGIKNFNKEQNALLLEAELFPLPEETPKGMQRIYFLHYYSLIPPTSRNEEVIRCIPSLYRDGRDRFNSFSHKENSDLISILAQIPTEKRGPTLKKAHPYLIKRIDNPLKAGILLAFAQEIGPEVFAKPMDPIVGMEEEDTMLVVRTCLAFMPPEMRTDKTINTIASYYNKVESNFSYIKTLKILSLFSEENQKFPIVNIIIGIFTGSPNQFYFLIDIIRLTGLSCPKEIIRELKKLEKLPDFRPSSFFGKELIKNLFSKPSFRINAYKHIQDSLESDLPRKEKWRLTQSIIECQSNLMLHEEHEIVQIAISVACVSDPDIADNPLNPYRIYGNIKKALDTEGWIPVCLETQEIAGEKVRWNLQKLREKGIWKGYKASDLPQNVNSSTLRELFNRFESRYKKLPTNIQNEIDNYIVHSCGINFSSLKISMLETPFLKSLVSFDRKAGANVCSVTFQLYCILQAVVEASPNVEKRVSEQEDMLFKMAASIQNCSTGQRDGIANFYNLLPSKYKYGPQAQESSVSKAERFVDDTIQKILNSVFVKPEFINEVVGSIVSNNESHFTEYLKNRYHRQVGLQHHPTFDLHTGVLLVELFEKKPEDIVACFFKHCTPMVGVRQLIVDSENAFKDKLYMGMMELITQAHGPIEGEENHRLFCVFNEDTLEPIRLTELGAHTLLKALTYF